MRLVYYLGRALQVMALIWMPFSIWVGQFGHSERGAITVFVGSIVVFFIGWVLARIR